MLTTANYRNDSVNFLDYADENHHISLVRYRIWEILVSLDRGLIILKLLFLAKVQKNKINISKLQIYHRITKHTRKINNSTTRTEIHISPSSVIGFGRYSTRWKEDTKSQNFTRGFIRRFWVLVPQIFRIQSLILKFRPQEIWFYNLTLSF